MKKNIAYLIIFFMLSSLAGCANYRPMVDFKVSSKTPEEYEVDIKECQEYAKAVNAGGDAAAGAVLGAILGAIMGGIVGAITGDVKQGIAIGASVGGIDGAVTGAASAGQTQKEIIRNCMRGRGYSVLN